MERLRNNQTEKLDRRAGTTSVASRVLRTLTLVATLMTSTVQTSSGRAENRATATDTQACRNSELETPQEYQTAKDCFLKSKNKDRRIAKKLLNFAFGQIQLLVKRTGGEVELNKEKLLKTLDEAKEFQGVLTGNYALPNMYMIIESLLSSERILNDVDPVNAEEFHRLKRSKDPEDLNEAWRIFLNFDRRTRDRYRSSVKFLAEEVLKNLLKNSGLRLQNLRDPKFYDHLPDPTLTWLIALLYYAQEDTRRYLIYVFYLVETN